MVANQGPNLVPNRPRLSKQTGAHAMKPRDLIFIIFCAAQLISIASESDERNHVAYVEHFLRLYPARLATVMQHMTTIEKHCADHGISPVTAVVVASFESSFKTSATGDIGEIGMFQVIPGSVCGRGFDLDTAGGQIAAGISCLAKARDACDGSLRQTLTMYASGSCKPRTKRTKKMITRRLRIIENWENRNR